MDRFTAFVMEHEGDDPAGIVLQRERWPDIDAALAADTVAGRRRMRSKAPSWHAVPELIYPSRLSVEQCSSEAACRIKTGILLESNAGKDAAPGRGLRVADLTGGLGMDSWAFSKICEKVLYVEMDSALAQAARHNFAALGCSNIEVLNAEVTPKGLREVSTAGEGVTCEHGGGTVIPETDDMRDRDGWDSVRMFAPDIIYLDPARRGGAGQKVFKLQDCRPDILQLKDTLLDLAPTVMVKLSPMADIDIVLKQLGPCCRRLDIISIDNECKELVVMMEQSYNGDCQMVADCGGATSFTFSRSEESAAVPLLFNGCEELTGRILLEPDKALMKAGPFKLLSSRLGLVKLDVSTHYYIQPDAYTYANLFRQFRILRVEPLNNRTLKAVGKDCPCAEVTARNIPLGSDELRRRLSSVRHPSARTASGSDGPSSAVHIFGLRAAGTPLLLVTERLF